MIMTQFAHHFCVVQQFAEWANFFFINFLSMFDYGYFKKIVYCQRVKVDTVTLRKAKN